MTMAAAATPMQITNIVFSSGSIGGLTFFGAWKALEEATLTSQISNFSGCSMGSLAALLTSLGYTGEELQIVAESLRYRDHSDIQIANMLESFGLESGNKMCQLLSALIRFKTGRGDLTFRQHYDLTGRMLWINASCVEDDRCYYFSSAATPDLSVIKAVRMSISIPFIMAVVKHDGKTFIDGAFHDPCPFGMFPVEKTVVFRVHNAFATNSENAMVRYIAMIAQSISKRLYPHAATDTATQPPAHHRIININSGIGGFTFEARRGTRKQLFKTGYETTKAWLKANAA